MDNRTLDARSEGEEGIALALKLIWSNAPGGKATHYKIARYTLKTEYYQNEKGKTTHHITDMVESEKGSPTLILFWSDEELALPLPFPLDLDGSIQFVENWLKDVDYGREPDHDGDNGKGWRIFTEAWGHVAGHHYAIVGVQPMWAMYGK